YIIVVTHHVYWPQCRHSACQACQLNATALIERNPLALAQLPKPAPAANKVLVRVRACAVCRTDLHVIEGELPPRKMPVIPGHQVVGTVEAVGSDVRRFSGGERVGIAWLGSTCGVPRSR